MRRLGVIFSVMLCSALVMAQNASRKDDTAINNLGIPISQPTVRICTEDATGIPCTPLATIYTDKDKASAAANPFAGDSFGNFNFYAVPGWYVVQVSAPGLTAYSYKVLLAPDVEQMGPVIAESVSAYNATDASASSGFMRLTKGDQLCWRNESNTGNVCLSKNVSDQIVGATASVGTATQLTSANAPVAATGVVQLGQSDGMCWRNAANSGDVCLNRDANDRVNAAGGLAGANFVSSTASPAAAAGLVRLGQADSICWRNEGNTADVCISKDNGDNIVGVSSVSVNAQSLTSATANPATSGVIKLASVDQMCWRNNANSANTCISKDTSDQFQVPGGININNSHVMTTAPRGVITASFDTTAHARPMTLDVSGLRLLSTTVPAGIKLERVTMRLSNSSTTYGCSVFPAVQVQTTQAPSGVTGGTLTTVDGTQVYSSSITANNSVDSGENVSLVVTSGGTGCTNWPNAGNVAIWYYMQ